MTPLAPLRILFTGLLGLFVLGFGIYGIWRYVDAGQPSPEVAIVDTQPDNLRVNDEILAAEPGERIEPLDVERISTVDRAANDIPPWVFLVGGLLLVGLSLFGRWPLIWTSKLLSSAHAPLTPTRELGQTIDRPDGTRLNVEICGNLSGPTLVFTHGWSLDSTAWHYAKTKLSDRFRLVLWDLPGLGRSRAPNDGNFEIAKMADDLHAVVSSIRGSKKVYLVGHSIGGMITQIYGGKYRDSLRDHIAGMVLVHTTYTNPLRTMLGAPLWTVLENIMIKPSQYLMIGLAPLAYLSNWQSYFNGSMQMTTRLTSFTGEQTFQQVDYASWLAANAWPGVIARGNLAMFRYDAQSALKEIDVPLLVIGGNHDRITKPEASERIVELAPRSESLRNAGGHLAMLEFHEEVMDGIATFVEKSELRKSIKEEMQSTFR